MIRSIGFILLAFLWQNTTIQAQGIEFFHGSWEEALAEAKAQDKPIFIDTYTTWCGPCKRMAKMVFTQQAVGDYYNENFVNVKIDMEKTEGLKFGKKYPVSAFPTLYFIDNNGKVLHKVKGAQPADKFVALGKFVASKIDKSKDFEKDYADGKRDPAFVLAYVKALNKSGKSSLKVANDYLKEQKDLTTPENLNFILAATTEADSRIFKLLIEHRDGITALNDAASVEKVIESACQKTAAKAIEFKSEDLHKEAKTKMKKNLPAKAANFAMHADLKFYQATENAKAYLKASNLFAKKEVKNNAAKLNTLATDLLTTFTENKKALKKAEQYAKKATENGGLFQYYQTYASILFLNGKNDKALAAAKKAFELTGKDRNAKDHIMQLIKKIEQKQKA